jgi:thioredoxin-like negative regulator of GroEL
MTPLLTQEQFEDLLRPRRPTDDRFNKDFAPVVGVAFGAEWCGPCRRTDKDAIADATPWIKWYYCDVDENNYTPGYCKVQGIPCFILIVDGMFQDEKFNGGSVDQVVAWAKRLVGDKVKFAAK